MYDKDFLKQLLHPKHLHNTSTSVKNNKRQIEKERKEFSVNKLAKNHILRKGLKLSFYDIDQKENKEVNIKNADKDLMNYMQPKSYLSPIQSGDNVDMHSLNYIKSNSSKLKMPMHVVDKDIKVVKTHNMFDWFPTLINKIHKDGINMTGKIPASQNEVVKKLKLGNEEIYSYTKPDGSIKIDVRSPYASSGVYTMEYTPPKLNTDKQLDMAMHVPASFKFLENNEEVHPNKAISDTLHLESKLTGRHISALRNDKK